VPVVGTAGHVDHGKSTLVRALTGRDPDRWAEEKRRGLTIDLGFAWCDLGTGEEVAFVDVPGHERFIKNMLAGVGGVDVALFVVAADEGWMPQSEEHLAVLDLLGVRHGVVALTRVDLVDRDLLELARLDVDEHVAGTSLESWPVVAVSPVTGEGLDELRRQLGAQLVAAGPAADLGRPRLWVDRSFVVSGAGVIVTGTLVGGSLAVDDTLEIAGTRDRLRVRGLQRHETPADRVAPGNRVAVNVGGVGRDRLPRGTLLVVPGTVLATSRATATLRAVRGLDEPPGARGAYHLHVGTATVPVRLRLRGGWSGDAALAGLRFERPVPLRVGDRFVLRETGRRAVVAGGRILTPTTDRLDRASMERLRAAVDLPYDERADVLVEVHGRLGAEEVVGASGGGEARRAVAAAGMFFSRASVEALAARAREQVAGFHADNPLRAGMPKAELASRLDVPLSLVDELVAVAGLVDEGATVRREDFEVRLTPAQEAAWEAARAELSSGLAVPRASRLGLDEELLHALVRSGRLVVVDDDLVYLPEQIEEIVRRLAELPEQFTVSRFREQLGLSRRQAVPLLEWLDAAGHTRRSGDLRTRRPSV